MSACVAVDTGLGHLAAALDVPNPCLFRAADQSGTDRRLWASQVAFVE